jgi:hypothetical protein
MDDIQDSTIIESAIPYELDQSSDVLHEEQAGPGADATGVRPVELDPHHTAV